ncbi:Zinc finger FYVE domain-containing protein 9, partial [Ataeniobius toweri]|nr:Zinc finger FYVE domain-containing protein 9 [Ataeniobius toweri]
DFRNYRYSLPLVPGLTVDLEAQKTLINIPTTGYNELMKAINKSKEHVLAIGASFNENADSHLICVQTDDGQYQTQAISIHNQPRKGNRSLRNCCKDFIDLTMEKLTCFNSS